ncbi:MAG: hypothetical protein QOD58_4670 [Mycobacterium sp.]|nr:hypothetical protein [Mycobacterium sp.]
MARSKAARQPSRNTPVTVEATTTNPPATLAELALRNSMPTTTVDTQTITPVGASAAGRRQPRDSSQPNSVPPRNGHDVLARPLTLTPSS